MNRIYLLLLFFTIATFTQCSKRSTNVTSYPNSYDTYYYPDSELSANFRYKPGSYWIYKDTLSGRIDSFYVISSDTTDLVSVVHDLGISNFFHSISYRIKIKQTNINSFTGSIPSDWSLILRDNDARLSHADSGQISHTLLTFHYPLNIATGYATDSMIIMNSYNYYSVPGHYYNNVVEMSHLTATENDDFFINEYDGIVTMNINHPLYGSHRVWIMLRSFVIM